MSTSWAFLVECQPYDPALGTTRPVYFASNLPDDAALGQGQPYMLRLKQAYSHETSIFEQNLPGGTQISNGNAVLNNVDGLLDPLLTYAWDGRAVTVKRGVPGAPYSSYTTEFVGSTLELIASGEEMVLAIRDNSWRLAKPIQTVTFQGNGGLEGTADLKGRRKPLLFGKARNLLPVPIDNVRLISQLHSGTITSVDAVYDRGVPLTFWQDFDSYASLAAASVPHGYYATSLQDGLLRLGASPVGDLTVDAKGRYGTLGNIPLLIKNIIKDYGGLLDADLDITLFDEASLEAPYGFEGFYFSEPNVQIDEVIESMVASYNGFWFLTRAGKFATRRFKFRTPAHSIRQEDVRSLQRQSSPNELYRVKVNYAKNLTVQDAATFTLPRQAINGRLKDYHVFVATALDGSGGSYTYTGEFEVYLNQTKINDLGQVQFRKETNAPWLNLATDGSFTISDPGTDNATVTLSASMGEFTLAETFTLIKSKGASPKNLVLTTSGSHFYYDSQNTPSPSSQQITVTATGTNLSAPYTFVAIDNLNNPVTLTGSGNTRTIDINNILNSLLVSWVAVSVTSADGTSNLVKTVVLHGDDGYAAGIISAMGATGDSVDIFYQNEPPGSALEGTLWFDLDDSNKLYRRVGSSWVLTSDARIATALTEAATAQATADGKVRTFFTESTPTAEALGDLWYQPSSKILRRWNGGAWDGVSTFGADLNGQIIDSTGGSPVSIGRADILTSMGTSLDTTKVGGRPSATVLSQIDGLYSAGAGDLTPPSVPSGLFLNSTLQQDTDSTQIITLVATWTPITGVSDLAGYVLAIKEGIAGNYVEFVLGPNASRFERIVPANKTYYAKILAYDNNGNKSAFSAEVNTTTVKDTTPPSPITSGSTAAAFNSVFLAWTNPADTDLEAVDVYEGTNTGNGTLIATVKATPSIRQSFTRTGLASGTTRYYWLIARDSSGNASTSVYLGPVTTAKVDSGDLNPQSVDYNAIALGAVKASRMYIGDTSNAFPDADLADPACWFGSNTVSFFPSTDNTLSRNYMAMQLNSIANSTANTDVGRVTAEGGAEYQWRIAVFTDPGVTITPYAVYYTAAGVASYVAMGTGYTGGALSRRTLNVTLPATAKFVGFHFDVTGTAGAKAYVGEPVIRRAITTDLIVDGAVKARHIEALSITAAKIAVGSLTGDRLQAGTINGDRIATRTLTTDLLTIGAAGQLANNLVDLTFWDNTITNASGAGPGVVSADITVSWNLSTGIQSWMWGSSPTSTSGGGSGSELLLRSQSTGASNGSGGWNMYWGAKAGFNKNRAFRYCVWVNIDPSVVGGYLYHGTGGAELANGTDPSGGNPYFFSYPTSALPKSRWLLMVGVVHPAGVNFSESGLSGLWDPVTGRRLVVGIDWRWQGGATLTNWRSYQFYANTGDVVYFGQPIVEELNSRTRTLASMFQSMDYAQNINGGSTTILPGLIQVSGGTTLADWRQGGDNTKIAGGAISANTISANKLTIGNRGVTFIGLTFRWEPSNNWVYWTDGYMYFVNDAGVPSSEYINAGNTGGAPPHRWFTWVPGTNTITATQAYAISESAITLGSWWGGDILNITYGGTIINGTRITTGTVTADRLSVGSLSAISGTIGLLRTTNTGARVEVATDYIKVFDFNNFLRVHIGNLAA